MKTILLIGLIVGLIVWLLKKMGPIGTAVAALVYIAWFYIPTGINDSVPADPVKNYDSVQADPVEISDSVTTKPEEINDNVVTEPVDINNEVEAQKNIYFVNTGRLNIRVRPGVSGEIVDMIDKGQKIEVLEIKGDWARISKYFDGEDADRKGGVALWVYAIHLSTYPPTATRAESKTIPIAKE